MSPAYIVDTSFLLELNGITGHCKKERIAPAKKKYTGIIKSIPRLRIYITVPVLFEYAGHIHKIKEGKGKGSVKRNYAIRLDKDINDSLENSLPWVIHGTQPEHGKEHENDTEHHNEKEFLLKTHDIIALSEKFADNAYDHSFVDLSVIQAKEQLEERHNDEIELLAYDERLESHFTYSRERPLP